jgi:hypothetical protein
MTRSKRPMKTREPENAKEKLLCERYMVHLDPSKAWIEAGYAKSRTSYAPGKLRELQPYLARLKPKVEKKVAEEIALSAQSVLAEMTAMAFTDPMDYFEIAMLPVLDPILGTPILDSEGKEVFREGYRRIDPAKLSPRARKAIGGMSIDRFGRLNYELVDPATRFGWLRTLGQHVGLFHDKIIHEAHMHTHQHNSLSFKDVPTDQLESLQKQLITAIGHEAARQVIGPSFDADGEFEEKP